MVLDTAAVAVHVLLADVHSLAAKAIPTQAELPAAIVVIVAYLVRGDEVVTIESKQRGMIDRRVDEVIQLLLLQRTLGYLAILSSESVSPSVHGRIRCNNVN